MCKVIAVANQKGGVGKTTTCVNLGIGLARSGKKVLLIDADAQGSLTASLGWQRPDQLDITLANIFNDMINNWDNIDVSKGILHHAEEIDLLPGNIELSGAELSLVAITGGEFLLRDYVDRIKPQYDYILIDCTPSLGMLTMNALIAADSVLIPVQAAYLPTKGLQQLIRTISMIRNRRMNPNLKIAGILFTMVDLRTSYAREVCDTVRRTYKDQIRIFSTMIPLSVRAVETAAAGESIYKYDPKGKVAASYEALTKEVLSND
jgi:chromosome partitioning protein